MQDKNTKSERKFTLDLEGEKQVDQLSHWLLADIKHIAIRNHLHLAIDNYFTDDIYERLEEDLYNKIQDMVRLAYLYGKGGK